MCGGQKTIFAHMALREHRIKHTGHPYRRHQGGFVGNQMGAGSQHVAVRPLNAQFFGAQHHMRVGTVIKRQQFIV